MKTPQQRIEEAIDQLGYDVRVTPYREYFIYHKGVPFPPIFTGDLEEASMWIVGRGGPDVLAEMGREAERQLRASTLAVNFAAVAVVLFACLYLLPQGLWRGLAAGAGIICLIISIYFTHENSSNK